jgi:hypothetical protein
MTVEQGIEKLRSAKDSPQQTIEAVNALRIAIMEDERFPKRIENEGEENEKIHTLRWTTQMLMGCFRIHDPKFPENVKITPPEINAMCNHMEVWIQKNAESENITV